MPNRVQFSLSQWAIILPSEKVTISFEATLALAQERFLVCLMGAAARKKFPDKDSFSWTMLREASLVAVRQVCGQVTDRFPKVPKSVADVWNRFLVVREKHKKTRRFIYTWNGDAAGLSVTDSLGGQHDNLRTFTCDREKGELHYRTKQGGQIIHRTAKCDDAVFDDIELIRSKVFEAQSLTEELEDVATTAGPAFLRTATFQVHLKPEDIELDTDNKFDPMKILEELPEQLLQEQIIAASTSKKSNISTAPTSFVGRDDYMAWLVEKLTKPRAEGVAPVVAIWGAPGLGKTRLATEVCRKLENHFAGGTWLVDMTHSTSVEDICAGVARVFNLSPPPEPQLAAHAVGEFLTKRKEPTLLFFDNCDHALNAVTDAIGHWRKITHRHAFLLTSREQPGVEGQTSYELPPLDYPEFETAERVPRSVASLASVQLFVDRAESRSREPFALTDENAHYVVGVTAMLEGIPLAIELAAARVLSLGVKRVHEQIRKCMLPLLMERQRIARKPDHHQTLQAAIQWSYELLEQHEKVALLEFSVFRGGCFYDAAEAVLTSRDQDGYRCIDLIEALHQKGFLRKIPAPEDVQSEDVRYTLFEAVRAYARSVLDRLFSIQQREQLFVRHCRFYRSVPERTLAHEIQNIFASLDHAIEFPSLLRSAVEGGLQCEYLITRSPLWKVAVSHLERLANATEGVDADLRGVVGVALTRSLLRCGMEQPALAWADESRQRVRRRVDVPGRLRAVILAYATIAHCRLMTDSYAYRLLRRMIIRLKSELPPDIHEECLFILANYSTRNFRFADTLSLLDVLVAVTNPPAESTTMLNVWLWRAKALVNMGWASQAMQAVDNAYSIARKIGPELCLGEIFVLRAITLSKLTGKVGPDAEEWLDAAERVFTKYEFTLGLEQLLHAKRELERGAIYFL